MYAYDINKGRLVMMKQCWRTDAHKMLKEHEVYSALREGGVRHLPEVWFANDIQGPNTASKTQEFNGAATGRCNWMKWTTQVMPKRQLYRIALETVCVPLVEFRSTRELVSAIRDAAICKQLCIEKAKSRQLLTFRSLKVMPMQFSRVGSFIAIFMLEA